MSEIRDIHFHDYSIAPNNRFCVCCLSKNVPVVHLRNCKHSSFFENAVICKMEKTDLHICQRCHKTIENFELFRQQVIKNLEMLDEQKIATKPYTRTNLKLSNIELNWAVKSKPIEHESVEPTNQESSCESEEDITIEREYLETDIPSPQIKETKQITKRKKGQGIGAIRKMTKLQKQYEGVWRIIFLTEEEMLQERIDDSKKKSYLNLPYKCEDCVTGFDHDITLKEHLETRHQKKNNGLKCHICKSVLNTKLSFEEHKKRHYRRYECLGCFKRYSNCYTLLKHYNEFHGKLDTQYRCELCDFVTESHRSFRYHKERHRTPEVECEKCGKTFTSRSGLRAHNYTIHGLSSRVYACDKCGKRYRGRPGLAAHAQTHAASNTVATYCVTCNTHFRTPMGLKRHLKTHSKHVNDDDRKFPCEECDAKFLSKSALRQHIDWIHLNNVKYECKHCSKVFKSPSILKKHVEYVHEKKRPPRNKICDHCGRGFTTLAILRSHIRTHTGERPLKCDVCPATFAHPAARYTHLKLLHSAQTTEK